MSEEVIKVLVSYSFPFLLTCGTIWCFIKLCKYDEMKGIKKKINKEIAEVIQDEIKKSVKDYFRSRRQSPSEGEEDLF